MVTISKKSLFFTEIAEESKENFVQAQESLLSDFEATALKWLGDAIREKTSQHFWCNNCYCWFDKTQQKQKCVWLTVNGIAMFEDISARKLYRIGFRN